METKNVTSYFFVPPTKVNQTTNAYANAGGTTNAIGMDLTNIDVTLNTIIDILEPNIKRQYDIRLPHLAFQCI